MSSRSRSKPTRRVKKPARWWFIRRELGLSQTELGAIIGVHWQTIGRWDRAETVPSESTQWLYKLLLKTHRSGDRGAGHINWLRVTGGRP